MSLGVIKNEENAESPNEWKIIHGDEAIKKIPKPGVQYMGHSSARIDWLLDNKDLRVGLGGGGSLDITAINMPNDGKEFLAHLKMRIDPNIDYYHRGPYVVVLAIPPELYKSRGYHPDSPISYDDLLPGTIPNVQVLEEGKGNAFATPTRFILGYYDGTDNSFHLNPNYESDPAPTEFGLAATKKMQEAVAHTRSKIQANESNVPIVTASDDIDDDVW